MQDKSTFEGVDKILRALEKGISIQEISEHESASENEIVEIIRRWAMIFNAAPMGIAIATPEGHFLEVNGHFYQMLGYKENDIKQMTFVDITYPTDRESTQQLADEVRLGQRDFYEIDKRYIKKNGDLVWSSTRATPVRDKTGRVKYWIGLMLDITERKKTEEALASSRERLDSIIRSIPDIIYRLDTDGRITFLSDSVRLYGYIPENMLGTNFLELIHPEDRVEAYRRIKERRTRERGGKSFEARVLTKSPSGADFKIFNISAEGLYKSNKPSSESFLGTQGIARDITDRKMLEDELNQARTMQAIGTLAGGIAHDFNNLLLGIQGYASIMIEELDEPPYTEMLKNIEEYVEQAANLTKQLLGLAKGGKYEVKLIDLNDLMKNHNRIFGRTRKEITIYETFETEPCLVNIDKGQIQQVFMNLYVNASQAMPHGGDLYIQTENIYLDENYATPRGSKPGRYVKVSVTDTGIGMDKDTLKRIFDPFYTTKYLERGTGLGLASVYGIIKNHEGIINVYSEKDNGTTFNIYLPAQDRQVLKREGISQIPKKGSETVLLVDDEEMVLEVGKTMMETLGYKVFTARGGKEAIEVYKESQDRIDLVILDMIMPKIDGRDTYIRLKKINPNIRVLLSSGYSINGKAKEILDQGCNDFIQKPFNVRKMAIKIREVLDN